jgi:hypothetical protein
LRDANGKTIRGKRAGRSRSFDGQRQKDIHSRIAGLPAGHTAGHAHNVNKNSSSTALAINAAQYFESAIVEETAEDYLVPRQSITRKQLLSILPRESEFERIPTRRITLQRDKQTGAVIEVADELPDRYRVSHKADRTLLRRDNPFKDAESERGKGYKREGTVSVGLDKRTYREAIPSANPVMEREIGPELEGFDPVLLDEPKPVTDAEIEAALKKL